MNLSHILLEKKSKIGTTKQSPVESGGLILVYMYIKWCIPVVLVVFYISYNFQQNKY
jgi:hypothetical protein